MIASDDSHGRKLYTSGNASIMSVKKIKNVYMNIDDYIEQAIDI